MKVQKMELTVPNKDLIREIKDPRNKDIRHVETLLPFDEINKLKRGNANVRPPEQRRKPFKDMMNTVEMAPQMFHIFNRGITYICSNLEFDGDKMIVTIPATSELKQGDNEKTLRYGIGDGGHTSEIINQTVNNIKDFENIAQWKMPYARVHFLIMPTQDNIEAVVQALNTSLQVQQYTLDEYQNKFEPLKVALSEAGFDPELVAWRENEDKEWHVTEIIQRMSMFLTDRWVGTQPINMYKSKSKALKLYTSHEGKEEFKALYPVIKDVITLPEYIQSKFSEGGIIELKSLAKLKGIKVLSKKKDKAYLRPGTEYPTHHKIDMAALLPIAAAFRELLVRPAGDGEEYSWRVDYKKVFEHCAQDLYNHLVKRMGQVAFSNQLGTDMEFWTGCVTIVLRAKDDILEESGLRSMTRKKAPVKTVKPSDEDGFSQVEEEEVVEEEIAED